MGNGMCRKVRRFGEISGIFRCIRRKYSKAAHLKKVLALVMAFAMAFTMMAGAAFTDSADIEATEAVDTLSALGVINGYEDGSFKPNGTVTRAEMAAMIYIVRNSGKTDASGYENLPTSFTDIKGHWAEGYIKHAQTMGIISGRNDKTFDPNAKVTGVEAALMCLRTAGYDAAKAGIGGAAWANKTLSLANEAGLLDDVKTDLASACPRQWAAQLIFNLLDTDCVTWSNDSETFEKTNRGGQPYGTVGEKYMGLKKSISTLNGVVKESGKDTYKVTLGEPTEEQKKDSTDPFQKNFTKVEKDYSALKNQVVKVLYKDTDEVYGVFATDDTSVLNGVVGDFEMDGTKVKFDGEKYSVVVDTKVTVDTESTNNTSVADYIKNATGATKAADAVVVLNDEDKVSKMDVTSYMVGKVSYVGKDYVNVVYKAGTAASKFDGYSKLDKDSCNSDLDGLKKDDYVILTNSSVNSKLDAVKAELVEGKITSTRDNGNEIKIDGAWYESALTNNTDIALSNEVAVVLKDGYVVFVDDAKTGSTDVALLVEAAKNSGIGAKWQADLLFADGTRKVVDIDTDESSIMKDDANLAESIDAEDELPVLVTYAQSGSKYELDLIAKDSNNKYAGYDKLISSNTYNQWHVKDGKVVGGDGNVTSYINESATIFLQYGDDDYKVVTGAAMKDWGESYKFSTQILADNSNGYPYAKVAFVKSTDMKNPTGSDKTYGYIFGVEEAAKDEDNNNYVLYNIFDGTEATTLKVKQAASNAYAEGTVVEYTLDSDGYADCTVYGKDKLEAGFLTSFAWDGKDNDGDVKIGTTGTSSKAYKIDKDDTMVLFIDTDAQTGVVEADLQKAIEIFNESGVLTGYTKNVAFYDKGDNGTLDVLVVDVTNEIVTDLF